MHPDKKVGLALGILLIGITGAFFFRNDAPTSMEDTLTLSDPQSLDRKASQKPGAPYFPEPENVRRETDDKSELAGVPGTLASDVIPSLPQVGPTGSLGRFSPSSTSGAGSGPVERYADRMAPLPIPGRELDGLEVALSENGGGLFGQTQPIV
ncbi:MAG: hypothetical protein HQ518_15465 [Rhodopirellula sp.]|nr:hypothetical protein [Rhodopirellula sp.]